MAGKRRGIPCVFFSKAAVAAAAGGSLTDLLGLSISAQVTANTAVPGAIWPEAVKTSSGLDADICADDANNGNAGAAAQVFQCTSDLAQSWVESSGGELVRNGVCLTQSGSAVSLESCDGSAAQVRNVTGTGGQFNEIINSSSHQCLTAPRALDAVQLTGTACSGNADQRWTGPAGPWRGPWPATAQPRAPTRRSTSSRPSTPATWARSGDWREPVSSTRMTAAASAIEPG